jgi:ABC-type nickel/cobalt efflux system permease component RcnA
VPAIRLVIPAVCFVALATLVSQAGAHPVPRRQHDRTILVRLSQDGVTVDYRLDVDEFTVVFVDLPAVLESAELARLATPAEFYEAFSRHYASILADNLVVDLAGKALHLNCVEHVRRTRDDDGAPLDHLRFDFRFRAAWDLDASKSHQFHIREGNYELEDGMIRLGLEATPPVRLLTVTQPDLELQKRPPANLRPGDNEKLRKASAIFDFSGPQAGAVSQPPLEPEESHPSGLLHLLLEPHRGVWMLWLLAAGFGAVHALTPGHGKTLVAAYLVGEQGTVWHALLLGLVTTISHTGAVLALAGGLLVLYPNTVPAHIRGILGFLGGLLVAGLGFWLLLRRLSHQADHVHFGGGHSHSHHHVHSHDEQDGAWSGEKYKGVAGLIVLGISGGIVPCWDAIAMFGFGVSAQRLWLAFQLLVAFSAGLAAVLIAIGVAVVQVKGFASSRWGDSGLFRALPLVSAALVTGLGVWLCYDSIQGGI